VTFVTGKLQDRTTGQALPVKTFTTTRIPLVSQPAWMTQSCTRTERMRSTGLNSVQAFAQAQGRTDASMDAVITATGELDAGRYEAVLKPRALVGLRGAGYSYDGFYYVKNVTHSIRKGEYRQRFTLTREGLGAISPVLPS
jgi:cytolysin (calcineurin-like family phosphatase)